MHDVDDFLREVDQLWEAIRTEWLNDNPNARVIRLQLKRFESILKKSLDLTGLPSHWELLLSPLLDEIENLQVFAEAEKPERLVPFFQQQVEGFIDSLQEAAGSTVVVRYQSREYLVRLGDRREPLIEVDEDPSSIVEKTDGNRDCPITMAALYALCVGRKNRVGVEVAGNNSTVRGWKKKLPVPLMWQSVRKWLNENKDYDIGEPPSEC